MGNAEYMGSASETARGSHLHPKPVAGNRHHGQEEGIHDPREEEEAEDPAQEEGRGGAEEGEGCQVCLCQPTEAVQGLSPPSSVTMTDSIQGRWWPFGRPLLDDFIQFCHCHVLLVSLLLPS